MQRTTAGLHRHFNQVTLQILLGLLITISVYWFQGTASVAQTIETIKVDSASWGVSTRYIGTTEGSINFDIVDLRDLGINTYRIYGGMSRWEAEDDDGVYGVPTITDIKVNPNLINWKWWDQAMIYPPQGSDYSWSDASGVTWKGNAATLFGALKQAGIRPILTIRNVDNSNNPAWALQLNPPRRAEDWNEWWEHVFATVYWLNVRNDYQVDDFEVHNEPDNHTQGWGGNQADYFQLVKVAHDAIDHVYRTYLPDRVFHIHAPVASGHWPLDALQQIPTDFDSLDIHDYASDASNYAQQVHGWMQGTTHANSPVWLSEWGTYQGGYEDLDFSVNLIKNLIRASQPGDHYIYGSHIFSLYDWGAGFQGLIGANGERRLSYYAFRMGVRALQGGRPILPTSTSNPNLMAIATQPSPKEVYLLIVNSGSEGTIQVDADLSALMTAGTGVKWAFDANSRDEIVDRPSLSQGHYRSSISANSAVLLKFASNP